MANTPKVFISYSWDNDNHRNWVHDFAAYLQSNGIDVTLDQWEAVPGDQLPKFMEDSVRENDFVLIICTPKYKIKMDDRHGGVGYEGDVMTGEIFVKGNNRKFIPILRLGEWNEVAPSAFMGKYYIDLRKGFVGESGYKDLLRTLFGERLQKPKLGKKPLL